MHAITLQQVTFIAVALVTVGSAVMVVSLGNLFHRLLFLALSFLGVAGVYLLLSADFLAAAQILIYIGAIIVLMMFALMMTHRVMTSQMWQPLSQWWLAPLPISLGVFVVLLRVYVRHHGAFVVHRAITPEPTTGIIGQALLTKYVLPFEVASLVLLVAMVGAIILAKEDNPDDSR